MLEVLVTVAGMPSGNLVDCHFAAEREATAKDAMKETGIIVTRDDSFIR